MTGTASKVKLEEDIKLERLNKRLNEGTLCQNHQ
jgi:hypothetical protein